MIHSEYSPLLLSLPTGRSVERRPINQAPEKVKLYTLNQYEDQSSFVASVRTYGSKVDSLNKTFWDSGSVNDIFDQALVNGFYVDSFTHQLVDLGKLRNTPDLEQHVEDRNKWENSVIVEYPWRQEGRFVRILPHNEFREVVFSRNKYVFSDEALNKLQGSLIACAGMGVGTGILEVLVRLGAENLRFCDAGKVLLKDLNRLSGGDVHKVGVSHAWVAYREYMEINPYINIDVHDMYLGEQDSDNSISIDRLIDGASFVLEEIDNLALKPKLRIAAHKRGIPIITGTDTAYAGSVSLEMPGDKVHHGRLSDGANEVSPVLQDALAGNDMGIKTKLAIDHIVGSEMISTRFKESWLLAAQDGARYWSQPAISARLTSALVASQIMLLLEGYEVKREFMVDPHSLLRQ